MTFRVGDIVLWLALMTVPVCAQDADWHLFTQSHGGTVSLLHGLTKHACEFAMNRALHLPATDEEKEAARQRQEARRKAAQEYCSGQPAPERARTLLGLDGASCAADGSLSSWTSSQSYTVIPGDIMRAECFQ